MLWKKDKPNRDERLDRLGRTLIRASQATEEEIGTAISSPALLERIRARAATGEARPSGTINNWDLNNWDLNDWAADMLAARLAIAWRAVGALSLVAIVALALWLGAKSGQPENTYGNAVAEVEIIKSEPTIAPVTACSVATKEECAVSTDDAVAILVSAKAKETNR